METARAIESQVERVLVGKGEVVRLALTALLARGHLLIEDVPGVGKTTLARGLAAAIDASFARLQCTSDLMPTDMLGGAVLDPKTGDFNFRPGPIFHQIILADEVNRTTPKTQSALLEAMAEGQVSIDGVSHALPKPFFVVATQNPEDFHGTYPLPESQLDRFLICTPIGYPGLEVEKALLQNPTQGGDAASSVTSAQQLERAQLATRDIHVDAAIHDYLLALVHKTRSHASLERGASTRAALAFDHAIRAYALVSGRDHVLIDDVKRLAPFVLAHRVRFRETSRFVAREEATSLIQLLLSELTVPL